MLIVYQNPGGVGWHPIHYMVKLAVELLQADFLSLVDETPSSLLQKFNQFFWRRSKGLSRSTNEKCLVICYAPSALQSVYLIPDWRKRFRHIAAWVIDSFWLTHIPKMVQYSRPFDQFYITSEEDLPVWNSRMKVPTSCLPWGTDALRFGSMNMDRKWDLLRVGRQPPEWDSDSVTQSACADFGLQFHGRPQSFEDPETNQKALMEVESQSKFLLAFSNIANPAIQTHPVREYLTARWVDALACGATVAGIAPKAQVVKRLYGPNATLELATTKREEGLRIIADAVRSWRPEQAVLNHLNALKHFDWRWRYAQIAEDFGETPGRLEADIRLLKQTIDQIEGKVKM